MNCTFRLLQSETEYRDVGKHCPQLSELFIVGGEGATKVHNRNIYIDIFIPFQERRFYIVRK
jgi:hypothetical protein